MNILKSLFHFDTFVLLLIGLKIAFAVLSLTHIYLIATGKDDKPLDKNVIKTREIIEFIFKTLMAASIIYIFNPQTPKLHLINNHVMFLLFMYGILLLIDNEWGTIVHHLPKSISFPVANKIYEKLYKKKTF
jgi:hypothetical protein